MPGGEGNRASDFHHPIPKGTLMPLPSWKTSVTVTTPNGDTATAETPVCAPTETQAATSVITKLHADGHTPVDGRVQVEPNGNCTHQH